MTMNYMTIFQCKKLIVSVKILQFLSLQNYDYNEQDEEDFQAFDQQDKFNPERLQGINQPVARLSNISERSDEKAWTPNHKSPNSHRADSDDQDYSRSFGSSYGGGHQSQSHRSHERSLGSLPDSLPDSVDSPHLDSSFGFGPQHGRFGPNGKGTGVPASPVSQQGSAVPPTFPGGGTMIHGMKEITLSHSAVPVPREVSNVSAGRRELSHSSVPGGGPGGVPRQGSSSVPDPHKGLSAASRELTDSRICRDITMDYFERADAWDWKNK